MTKAEFIVTVKAAQRRNLRRVYAATATGIILVLPLVVLVLTNLITQRTFKVGLVLYSIASATAAIFILRRYGNRDVPCPHCQKPLWPAPWANKVLAGKCCVHCGHPVIADNCTATMQPLQG